MGIRGFFYAILLVGVVVGPGRAAAQEGEHKALSSRTADASVDASPSTEQLAPLDLTLVDQISHHTLVFDVAAGETLHTTFLRWTGRAGYSLVWRAQREYPLDTSMVFARGTTFDDAVRQAVHAVWQNSPTLKATLYRNKVLVITEIAK